MIKQHDTHADIIRGTTPTVRWVITADELDFSTIQKVWMTFKDMKNDKITIEEDDLIINSEERYIQYTLTQQQTLRFKSGTLRAQLRVLLDNGQALASEIKVIEVDRLLKGGVIC